MCSTPTQAIQHYVIKFVSDLRQVGCFLWVLHFPPSIKLTATILLKYCCAIDQTKPYNFYYIVCLFVVKRPAANILCTFRTLTRSKNSTKKKNIDSQGYNCLDCHWKSMELRTKFSFSYRLD